MSMHLIHRISIAAAFVAVLAPPVPSMAADRVDESPATAPVERTRLRDITPASLARDYKAERSYLPADHRQPTIGLALSGGGTKAGMFSHGVLHGLHDAKVLEHVDTISSVSGGGYAAFWYLSKFLESQRKPGFKISQIFADCLPSYWTKDDSDRHLKAAMLAAVLRPPTPGMPECENAAHFRAKGTTGIDDPYRFQAHIVRWPDILQVAPVYLDGGPQHGPEHELRTGAIRAVTSEVLKHLAGAKSAVPRLYQYGIERTWGLTPEPRDPALVASNPRHDEGMNWHYTNLGHSDADMGRRLIARADPETLQWAQLRDIYASPTATSGLPLWIVNATDGNKASAVNITKTFEITPFGFGSANPDHPGYVNSTPPPIVDLGTSVRASAGFADSQGVGNRVLQDAMSVFALLVPALQWGVDIEMPGPRGTFTPIRLSDGGGSENLGLYSLLKRGHDDIIVVDTAADPEGNMKDVCAVREALHHEDVELEFPALLNLKGVCEEQGAGLPKLAYNVSAWKNPVVKGKATWRVPGRPERVARIWLIKAAWDERAVAAAFTHPEQCGSEARHVNCLLAVFYGHNRSVHSPTDNYMLFPQLNTASTTANSSSYLIWGYRELGRMLGANLRINDAGRIELRDDRQCQQEALNRQTNRRPSIMQFRDAADCLRVSEATGG